MTEEEIIVVGKSKKINKVELFKELANYDSATNMSRFVNVDEFQGPYAELRLGNGGGWSRFDGDFGCKYRICIVRKNGDKRFSWDQTEDDEAQIDAELSDRKYEKGTGIMLIKICGLQHLNSSRPISQKIRDLLKHLPCVVCGTNSQIEIDHKNGLYNDPRVLDIKTQCVTDFQPLCKHCNDQKRQTCVWQKSNTKRYPATMIPQLAVFKIPFTKGTDELNENDIDGLVGTYWYDPVDFMKKVKEHLS